MSFVMCTVQKHQVRWTGHVVGMGWLRNAYTDSERLKGRSILKPRLRCEDNIKLELKETMLSVSTVLM